ncbi:MAG: hypothetical protein JSW26_21120 [Desulfobacterales bacterium]|nr:MAG: hypothetical protein JSW26_21120 [Desulfobacterales bacterium]
MLEILFSYTVVIFFLYQHFKIIPPSSRAKPEKLCGFLGTVRNWFSFRNAPKMELFEPARANTTRCKFMLYRMLYLGIGLILFSALLKIPEIQETFQALLRYVYEEDFELLRGPSFIGAFFLIAFFYIPPFCGVDASLRRLLYEKARIPAQQYAEQHRLRNAAYMPQIDVVQKVRKDLKGQGFCENDLIYETSPTARSMWLKVALLCEHARQYAEDARLGRELNALATDIFDSYEKQKPNAMACFAMLRNDPDSVQATEMTANLRDACSQLLDRLYELFSRIALMIHGGDISRIRAMKNVGFFIKSNGNFAVPESNDIICFALLLLIILFLPFCLLHSISGAIGITLIVFTCMFTPVFLLLCFPSLIQGRTRNVKKSAAPSFSFPQVEFPVLSAIVAGMLAVFIATVFLNEGNLIHRLQVFVDRKYPWTLMPLSYAFVLAMMIQTGELRNLNTFRIFNAHITGNWRNSLCLAVVIACVFYLVQILLQKANRPEISIIAAIKGIELKWYIRMALNTAVAGIIGFLLPTWHIVNRSRTNEETKDFRIRFILPSSLPSIFAVQEDRKKGIEIDRSLQWIEIEVPPTRVVKVQNIQIFDKYQIGDAVDRNGNHIPIEYVDDSHDDMKMLRDCGDFSEGIKFFVIGNRDFLLHCWFGKQKCSLEEMLNMDFASLDYVNSWSRLKDQEEIENAVEEVN